MPLPPDDTFGPGTLSVGPLDEVRLEFFTAEPTAIGPFGASRLSWQAEVPAGVRLKLGGLAVGAAGDLVVQPLSTTTYTLRAQSTLASRNLGSVTVTVDTAGCESYEFLVNARSTLQGALQAAPLPERASHRSPPAVSFAPGQITCRLRLTQSVDWFPNPDVDIDATFGLTVTDGSLAATAVTIGVEVHVPWWVWGIPGAIPGLVVAIDMAKDKVRAATRDAVDGLVQLLNFLASPSAKKRLRTVRVDDGNAGAGLIEVTACSDDLLRRYAAISEAVVRG